MPELVNHDKLERLRILLIYFSLLLCLYPEDSDYNPAEEDCNGRPPATLKKPAPPISSSSHGRPRRKVGRPRKYSLLDEGYSGQGWCQVPGFTAHKMLAGSCTKHM